MRRFRSAGLILTALLANTALAADWPAWRGPAGNGTTAEIELPTTWSAKENVTWKAPLPGGGNSTPVVIGDRVFLTCATDKGAIRSLICFAREDGKELWRKETKFEGTEPTHATNPYCSSTPATDGKALYVWFGSAGFAAYDLDGKELWRKDLGPFTHIWGNASSPVLLGDRIILSAGPGPTSALLAMEKSTGEIVWKTELLDARGTKPDDWRGSWATPVLHKMSDGKDELVLPLPGYVAAFDPSNGKERWRCKGLTNLCYANVLIGDGYIVGMSGYGGAALGMREPKADETGDLTASHRLWVVPKNQQRIGSGVITGGYVYMINEPGVGQCIDPKTGEDVWKQRITSSTWSSLVLSGENLYVVNQGGETVVWHASPKGPEVLHENPLGDETRASVVPSDGQIFIRTYRNLYCIGKRSNLKAG